MRIQHAALDDCACQRTLCQLLQCGKISSEKRGGSTDPLHASRRNYRTCHAIMHAAHVHNRAFEDSTTKLRDILVYASLVRTVSVGDVHPCYRLLRARLAQPVLSICRTQLLESLSWVRGMAMGASWRRPLSLREAVSRDSGEAAN